MKKWIMCSLVGCLGKFSWGQDTTVAKEAKPVKDTTHFFLFVNGSGNVNRTNDGTTYVFNNSIRFNVRGKVLNLNTLNSWVYGENPTKKTNNDFISAVDLDVFRETRRWYYWALAAYETSYSLRIRDKVQTGGGIGLNVIRKPEGSLILTDGLLYERNVLMDVDQYGRQRYETVRNSFRVKFHVALKDRFRIEGSNFFQNSLSDGDDYIIRSNTVASLRLYKALNLTMTLVYNRTNITARENLLFTYGLAFEKKF
ncbi:DUF481 domain-containing protein [Flavihumibacter petaseus]|uniref:DUF481 domain-containing protein n=1 Tax=Flavihumibacter petaseus NBRC 106054 TaxID=1220578 RepID=A0A0E9N0V7_9BACT|nr:DUF481 domain-containing protein [Flavihumibacter petaseus]GAO43393.1 hypothetical protein FPE01S_02_04980 [Flavihumibacter petaseus NBRC 106054]